MCEEDRQPSVQTESSPMTLTTSTRAVRPVWRSLAAALALAAICLIAQHPSAQQPDSRPELGPDYVWSGDQVIDRALLGAGPGGPERDSFQGTADDGYYSSYQLGFPGFNDSTGWSFGVLPIEFDLGIPQERRDLFFEGCRMWSAGAPIMCVPRTSQLGYLRVTAERGCFAYVGGARRLWVSQINLGDGCWGDRNNSVPHEIGHALGLIHEHQRPDRDQYIVIDWTNVSASIDRSAFEIIPIQSELGPYDFESVMHYPSPTSGGPFLRPQPAYSNFAGTMGRSLAPTALDYQSVRSLYRLQLRPLSVTAPSESPRFRFDRTDFLDAMERLHALYMSPMGLQRTGGLSLGGRPDFQGIATWIFDLYLAARSRGFSANQAFQIVTADVTRSQEWLDKHPGETPLTRPSFTPVVSFDRNEFLSTLNRLDAFYAAPEGLQRPDGLSISGGPDFLGIAAWLFDFYLNERLSGGSPTVAWNRVENAIRNTEEWRSKH